LAKRVNQTKKPTAISKVGSTSNSNVFVPARIISGGQTGVDRAGLDAAIALGIEHGGWCPRGRMSEDGTIPSRYELTEIRERDYRVRTEKNVLESDATLILIETQLRSGTALTKRFCVDHGVRYLVVNIAKERPERVASWLSELKPAILNVAGPRESSHPGIQERAMEFLIAVLTHSSSIQGS
jgi:Circularly permutated YpsA SLOG family